MKKRVSPGERFKTLGSEVVLTAMEPDTVPVDGKPQRWWLCKGTDGEYHWLSESVLRDEECYRELERATP